MADQPVEERRDLLAEAPAARSASISASVSARPCVICTSLPAQLPQQLHVVVAGHAERRAGRDHVHAPAAARPATSRPAVDQVADEDRLAPVGGMTRRPARPVGVVVRRRRRSRAAPSSVLQLVAAAVDVADDVERAVLVACGCSRAAAARSSAASTSSGELEHEDVAEALALQPAQRPPQLRRWLRTTCGPKSRSGRDAVALLADVARAGRARWRPAGTWYSRASSTSGLRASGWTLVASMTVSRPAASRLRGDVVQHLEGVVGRRLVVLVVARPAPRQTVRREHLGRLEVLRARTSTCPSRTAPIRTTRDSSGIVIFMRAHRPDVTNTAICVGGADARRPPAPTGRNAHRVAEPRRRRRSPSAWNSRARPLEAVVAVAELARPAASRTSRCTRAFGVVSDDRRRPGELEQHPLERRQPRRVEVLDHLDHARRRRSPPAARRGRSASRGSA